MKTDIFIKTYSKDKEFLEYLFLSIKKFLRGYNKIILVSDDNFKFNSHGIPFTFTVEKPRRYLNGYNNQILTKLNAFKYIKDTDRVLILDSDMIITQEWNIEHEDNNFYYRSWSEVGQAVCWKPAMDTLFNMDSEWAFMVNPGWFYTRHLHNCLNSYITQKYNTNSIEHAYKQLIKDKNLSEFEAMGHYLYYIDNLDYTLTHVDECKYPIRQFWSWAPTGVKEYQEEINNYLC